MSLTLENVSLNVAGEAYIYATTLHLQAASMNVLLGPTRSGKTTLMRLMAGLEKPTSGRILWRGEDVTSLPVQRRDIAMVYQQFINYPSMTVYENIASPLRLQKKSNQEIDKLVRESAAMMKLSDFLQRKPLELSGGQQQRCALARALVKGAGLVLLDEPLANLDYKLREEMRLEIPRLFTESGAIFVYATTEAEEALLLGGNTATLAAGNIVQFGATESVYREPDNRLSAETFSNPPMNFIDIQCSDGQFSVAKKALSSLNTLFTGQPDGSYRLGFRPCDVLLAVDSPQSLQFDADLKLTEITGSQSYLHLQHGAEHWVGLVAGIGHFEIGARISIFVNPSGCYLFDAQGSRLRTADPQEMTANG
ncbi:MAG: glycerol transport system ATP-binding protein [Paraglaciecola psychrophila]